MKNIYEQIEKNIDDQREDITELMFMVRARKSADMFCNRS